MTTTTTIRPMTQTEFERLRAYMFEDYARETAHVRSLTIEEGRAEATRQFDVLLPDGLTTQGHYFWRIVAKNGDAVGDLWVLVESAKEVAFIYFVGIDEAYRGHGYSKAAMQTLETTVKPLGANHIDLSVFGDNTVARRLYESLGYQPTAILMRKEI